MVCGDRNGYIVFVVWNYFSYINKVPDNYSPEVIDENLKPITKEVKEFFSISY